MVVLLIEVATIIVMSYVFLMLCYSMVRGAPYAATTDEKIEVMVNLLQAKKGEKAIDIGSGDGKIVIALAKAGIQTDGYEINPWYVFLSRYLIRREKLQERAKIYWGSYWGISLSSYSLITLFGTPHIMGSLGKKIRRETKKGTRVVSNHFSFPHWQCVKEKEGVLLYQV